MLVSHTYCNHPIQSMSLAKLSPLILSSPLKWSCYNQRLTLQRCYSQRYLILHTLITCITKIASPNYCLEKADEYILESTTDCRMMVLFRQTQRPSIYHPATIRDIPPEVLGETLFYFVDHGKPDLVSASLVCRAWYPVAQRLIVFKDEFMRENCGIERFVCVRAAANRAIALLHLFYDVVGLVFQLTNTVLDGRHHRHDVVPQRLQQVVVD